jgi:hypothetical protein
LYSRLRGYGFRIDHLQSAANGIRAFDGYSCVIMTEKEQGMTWTTGESQKLNQIIVDEHTKFQLLDVYPLPNGDAARLYVIQRDGA